MEIPFRRSEFRCHEHKCVPSNCPSSLSEGENAELERTDKGFRVNCREGHFVRSPLGVSEKPTVREDN